MPPLRYRVQNGTRDRHLDNIMLAQMHNEGTHKGTHPGLMILSLRIKQVKVVTCNHPLLALLAERMGLDQGVFPVRTSPSAFFNHVKGVPAYSHSLCVNICLLQGSSFICSCIAVIKFRFFQLVKTRHQQPAPLLLFPF